MTEQPQRNVEDARADWLAIAAAVILSASYATLRYNVFKRVPWSDWPHVIGNKILALASLLLIATAIWRLGGKRRKPIRTLMAVGSAMAVAHSLLSLAILDPGHLDKFYVGAKLTASAGASLLLGSLASGLLYRGGGTPGSSAPRASAPALGVIAFLSGCHAALPSASGWFDPARWPGAMPPITLISFLVGAGACLIALSVRDTQ